VHAVIGKMSFPEGDLVGEPRALHQRDREGQAPRRAKGQYIKKITVSGAMTPGVQVKFVGRRGGSRPPRQRVSPHLKGVTMSKQSKK
jgi:hypothetical protein